MIYLVLSLVLNMKWYCFTTIKYDFVYLLLHLIFENYCLDITMFYQSVPKMFYNIKQDKEQQQINIPFFTYSISPSSLFFDSNSVLCFATFIGTIVSAKVFIDKQTNLSKCFGENYFIQIFLIDVTFFQVLYHTRPTRVHTQPSKQWTAFK